MTQDSSAPSQMPDASQPEASANTLTAPREQIVRHIGAVSILAVNAPLAESAGVNQEGVDTAQQKVNAERAKNAGEGWKLHLNIDPTNTKHVRALNKALGKLKDEEDVRFKIGEGGGLNSDPEGVDEAGKEVTLYVGPLAKTKHVAELLESDPSLSHILLPAAGEVLLHDLPVTNIGKVWCRFDVNKTQPKPVGDVSRFNQWGPQGVPMMQYHTLGQYADEQVVAESVAQLKLMYGSFFDGNGLYDQLSQNRLQTITQKSH